MDLSKLNEGVWMEIMEEANKDQQITMLKARIKELEEGTCRFHCRKEKEAFIAGWGPE